MQKRDLAAIEAILKGKDPKTAALIQTALDSLNDEVVAGIMALKSIITETGQARSIGDEQQAKSYCEDIVCNLAACVFSSSCENGACSSNGCSANAGGVVTPPATCKGSDTCGGAACSSNAGGSCANETCSYMSS
jgi:hypothetical protein